MADFKDAALHTHEHTLGLYTEAVLSEQRDAMALVRRVVVEDQALILEALGLDQL